MQIARYTVLGRLGIALNWFGTVSAALLVAFGAYSTLFLGDGGWALGLFSALAGSIMYGMGRLSLFVLGGE